MSAPQKITRQFFKKAEDYEIAKVGFLKDNKNVSKKQNLLKSCLEEWREVGSINAVVKKIKNNETVIDLGLFDAIFASKYSFSLFGCTIGPDIPEGAQRFLAGVYIRERLQNGTPVDEIFKKNAPRRFKYDKFVEYMKATYKDINIRSGLKESYFDSIILKNEREANGSVGMIYDVLLADPKSDYHYIFPVLVEKPNGVGTGGNPNNLFVTSPASSTSGGDKPGGGRRPSFFTSVVNVATGTGTKVGVDHPSTSPPSSPTGSVHDESDKREVQQPPMKDPPQTVPSKKEENSFEKLKEDSLKKLEEDLKNLQAPISKLLESKLTVVGKLLTAWNTYKKNGSYQIYQTHNIYKLLSELKVKQTTTELKDKEKAEAEKAEAEKAEAEKAEAKKKEKNLEELLGLIEKYNKFIEEHALTIQQLRVERENAVHERDKKILKDEEDRIERYRELGVPAGFLEERRDAQQQAFS